MDSLHLCPGGIWEVLLLGVDDSVDHPPDVEGEADDSADGDVKEGFHEGC